VDRRVLVFWAAALSFDGAHRRAEPFFFSRGRVPSFFPFFDAPRKIHRTPPLSRSVERRSFFLSGFSTRYFFSFFPRERRSRSLTVQLSIRHRGVSDIYTFPSFFLFNRPSTVDPRLFFRSSCFLFLSLARPGTLDAAFLSRCPLPPFLANHERVTRFLRKRCGPLFCRRDELLPFSRR